MIISMFIGEETMMNVDVDEFQKGLPNYMKQIGNGEEINISSQGRVVARVIPVQKETNEAKKRLRCTAWYSYYG